MWKNQQDTSRFKHDTLYTTTQSHVQSHFPLRTSHHHPSAGLSNWVLQDHQEMFHTSHLTPHKLHLVRPPAGPQEWVWQELKTLAEMKFLFQVCVKDCPSSLLLRLLIIWCACVSWHGLMIPAYQVGGWQNAVQAEYILC